MSHILLKAYIQPHYDKIILECKHWENILTLHRKFDRGPTQDFPTVSHIADY